MLRRRLRKPRDKDSKKKLESQPNKQPLRKQLKPNVNASPKRKQKKLKDKELRKKRQNVRKKSAKNKSKKKKPALPQRQKKPALPQRLKRLVSLPKLLQKKLNKRTRMKRTKNHQNLASLLRVANLRNQTRMKNNPKPSLSKSQP